jgi:hypothetical protein
MKISEQWLREWVNPSIESEALLSQLTSAGCEVEGVTREDDDNIIEINLTPNRGDCLSIVGIAREVAIANHIHLNLPKIESIPPTIKANFNVEIQASKACPRYTGRIKRVFEI